MSLALGQPQGCTGASLGCSRARDNFGSLRPSPEKTTCSFPYRFLGNPGIRALYQAIGIPMQVYFFAMMFLRIPRCNRNQMFFFPRELLQLWRINSAVDLKCSCTCNLQKTLLTSKDGCKHFDDEGDSLIITFGILDGLHLKIGACAMTTAFLDNKWRFPREKQSSGLFSSLPPSAPLSKKHILFLLSSHRL